jgi:hypothetical protein
MIASDEEPEAPSSQAESGAAVDPAAPSAQAHERSPHDLTAAQQEYLAWFVDPNRAGSKKDWARSHKIHEGTPRQWELQDKFQQAVNRRLSELNLDAMRIQRIIDALYEKALEGDTKAADMILKYVDRLNPHRIKVEDTKVEEMSDAELRAALLAAMPT